MSGRCLVLTFIGTSFIVAVQPDLSLIPSVSAADATLGVVGPGPDRADASKSFGTVTTRAAWY